MARELTLVERIVDSERFEELTRAIGLIANDGKIHRSGCFCFRRYDPERYVNNGYDKLYTPFLHADVLISVLTAQNKQHSLCRFCMQR